MKRVCVVTATRAEYGAMKRVIKAIYDDKDIELCLLVTGTHLSETYGYTIREIMEDEIPICRKLPILDERNDEQGIIQTMSQALLLFSRTFQEIKPDILVVCGDRYELLSICDAALIYRIPIVHISGGEVTEGAIDDIVRHSVTKMSHLHFPACEEYRQRIIQMGEYPDRVFNYGDIGVENIKKMNFLELSELESDLQISLKIPFACVTYHPVTLERGEALAQIREITKALSNFNDMQYIFTKSNSDIEGQEINDYLKEWISNKDNCYLFSSLGVKRYLSLVKYSEMVIGNSSSGIIEAPCFGIPTVNIGTRQQGRLRAESIIDCDNMESSIICAIKKARTEEFKRIAKSTKNPYEYADTSKMIVNKIKQFMNDKILLKKQFYNCIKEEGK